MQPRISALVGSPLLTERSSTDILPSTAFSQPASNALSRPLPVEPHHLNHDPNVGPTTFGVASRHESRLPPVPIPPPASSTAAFPHSTTFDVPPAASKSAHLARPSARVSSSASLPLDSVLNAEDGASHLPRKRRKVSVSGGPRPAAAPHPAVLELPKPPPQKRSVRRQRLAPILPGLYQPPPHAGLFPSISVTEEGRLKKRAETRRSDHEADARAAVSTPVEETAGSQGVAQNHTPPEKSRVKALGGVSVDQRGPASAVKPADPSVPTAGKPGSRTRQKRKWTDRETEDLLKGVARFGIGRWAKILQCPDYTFNGRTAVDLKDRFRTCRPDDYRKAKMKNDGIPTKPTGSKGEKSDDISATRELKSDVARAPHRPISLPPKRAKRVNCDRKDASDLAAIGINQPFVKVSRRELTRFTDEEDALLLKGFEKHGSQWNKIRDDPAFEALSTRSRLDLRDRFRVKYPVQFVRSRKLRGTEGSRTDGMRRVQPDSDPATEAGAPDPSSLASARPPVGATPNNTDARDGSLKTPTRATATFGSILDDFLSDFDDDFDDFTIDEYPTSITLSRRIFEEAPAAKSVAPATGAGTAYPADAMLISSAILPVESLHIDPLQTIIPSASGWPAYGASHPFAVPHSLNASASSASILHSLLQPTSAAGSASRSNLLHPPPLPQPLPPAPAAPPSLPSSAVLPPSLSGILSVDAAPSGAGHGKPPLPPGGMTLPRPAELLHGYGGDAWQF